MFPGTPYYGGVFKVKLALGKEFPQTPPKAFFLTKIFHPNVAANGEICVNTLKKDWKPDLGIKHILLVTTTDFGQALKHNNLFPVFLDNQMSADSSQC